MAPETLSTCATCEVHAEAVFRVEGMDCREEVVILEQHISRCWGWRISRPTSSGSGCTSNTSAAKLTTSAMVEAVSHTGLRMWLEHEQPLDTERGRLARGC